MSVLHERAGKTGWIEVAGACYVRDRFAGTSSVRSFRNGTWMQMMAQSCHERTQNKAICLGGQLRCGLASVDIAADCRLIG